MREDLRKVNNLPEVEPQIQNGPGHEDQREGDNGLHAVQIAETVPDVPLQKIRLESDELEEETARDESEYDSHLRRSKRVKQK